MDVYLERETRRRIEPIFPSSNNQLATYCTTHYTDTTDILTFAYLLAPEPE